MDTTSGREDFSSYVVVIDPTYKDEQNRALDNDNNIEIVIKQEMNSSGVNCTSTENKGMGSSNCYDDGMNNCKF